MDIIPLTLDQENSLVKQWHRHHKPTVGHRFSLGTVLDGKLVGACIVGRPVCRNENQYFTAEINRLVTDGTKNACSFLYSAAARVCKEMGFSRIQTYILEEEPGTSLLASGWEYEITTDGGDWNSQARRGRRTDQPMVKKKRFAKVFYELI